MKSSTAIDILAHYSIILKEQCTHHPRYCYNWGMRPHLLVVDDEMKMCLSLKELLEKKDFTVSIANSAREALRILQELTIDLIVCDIMMPEMSGLLFLQKIAPRFPVIMITAYATVETARKAFKLGASDYLVKPFEFEELLVVINQKLKTGLVREPTPPSIWYLGSKNSAFLQMIEVAEKFASTDMPVLLTGESGTGKEVIADFIHFKSGRGHLPFIKINCAAIPESLLESELFGYERGAFTGAEFRKIGKFEEADKGTLLLDEIGDMPLQLQAKILRVLQDFEFSRLGGQERIRTDTRVFAASNQSLGDAIRAGKFRGDLYHRLNGVQVHIPPLRDRKEDLQSLADYFLERFNRKYDKTIEGFSTEACTALQSYDWPGNIRELRNYVERAVVICEERCVGLKHLPDSLAHHASYGGGAVDEYRQNYIRRVIIDALNKSNGSRLEAAKMLNVSRKTLYNWMRDLKIENEYK